uniref:non-specific serine/threonine protein kinase n=1 Tax=Amphilophus citrinellus TaxID=61819 RepID=A0A3Q0SIZ3_AMPCI
MSASAYSLSGFVFTVLCSYFTETDSSLQFLHCFHAFPMFFTEDVPDLQKTTDDNGTVRLSCTCTPIPKKLLSRCCTSPQNMENYERLLCLGRGGSADVFLMRHVERKCLYAVKRIKVEATRRAQRQRAVLQEAEIIRRLEHPHIVKCSEAFVNSDDGFVYIVMRGRCTTVKV